MQSLLGLLGRLGEGCRRCYASLPRRRKPKLGPNRHAHQPTPRHDPPRRKPPKFPLLAARKLIQGWDVERDEDDEEKEQWKSKNQRRREGARSFQMAKTLGTFTRRQIQNAIKFAFLPNEVLPATLMVQKMKAEGVREGKRRQYNFIARLVRSAELNLVQFVLNSLRDGHTEKLRKVIAAARATERDKQIALTAERWVQGLINKDEKITQEVFLMPPDQLDRAELRHLLREVRVQASRKKTGNDPLQGFLHTGLWRAKKSLTRFLNKVAVADYNARAALQGSAAAALDEGGGLQARIEDDEPTAALDEGGAMQSESEGEERATGLDEDGAMEARSEDEVARDFEVDAK